MLPRPTGKYVNAVVPGVGEACPVADGVGEIKVDAGVAEFVGATVPVVLAIEVEVEVAVAGGCVAVRVAVGAAVVAVAVTVGVAVAAVRPSVTIKSSASATNWPVPPLKFW